MSPSRTSPDPSARSHTALFVLLGRVFHHLIQICGRHSRQIDFPVNRPGQNSLECYTLAFLALILVAGYFSVLWVDLLGFRIWLIPLAMILGLLGAFLAFHVLFFSIAYLFTWLKDNSLLSRSTSGQVPLVIYLILFSLMALSLVCSSRMILQLIALPWLAWALANAFAALVLFAENFYSLLNREIE